MADTDSSGGYRLLSVGGDAAQSSRNAIEIRDLNHRYDKKAPLVLENMNLTVERGSIYGLLGPSGCGKTTMLKCILGQLIIHDGVVKTFGETPGLAGAVIPGPAVGYMPQDLALEEELTVSEVLFFYGKVFGMKREEVVKRRKWLMSFLELAPEKADSMIKNLSGGQARRISLMVALLHKPQLLVLDEPTVGVDPLLRTRIWNCLMDFASQGVTILITTHYIEEARRADCVGMMRYGRLLAEGPPAVLLQRAGMSSLEDMFLHLCRGEAGAIVDTKDATADDATLAAAGTNSHTMIGSPVPLPSPGYEMRGEGFSATAATGGAAAAAAIGGGGSPAPTTPTRGFTEEGASTLAHSRPPPPVLPLSQPRQAACGNWAVRLPVVAALVFRGLKQMQRNWLFIVFQFVLPAVQITLFCVAVGGAPRNLPFGVVNQDVGTPLAKTIPCGGSHYKSLGACLVSSLSRVTFDLSYYDSVASAEAAVRAGHSWGVLSIGRNFTNDAAARYLFQIETVATTRGSTVNLTLDNSDEQIAITVQVAASKGFQSMLESLLPGNDKALVEAPVHVGKPIYGLAKPSYTDFVAPGVMMSTIYGNSIGLTAISFVIDKKRHTLERMWTAGIGAGEAMMGSFITQSTILVGQIVVLLFMALYVFSIPIQGSLALAFFIQVLLGCSGMAFGLVISAVCKEVEEALQLSMGSFFPMFLLSGVIWPLQGAPPGLQAVAQAFPTTWTANCLRAVLSRGWGLSSYTVYMAFTVCGAWSLGLLILASLCLKSRE